MVMGSAVVSSVLLWVESVRAIPGTPLVLISLTAVAAAVGLFAFRQHRLARHFDRRRRRAVRRARAESVLREKIRESEERFRFLLESVEDYASFMLSPDGRITSWNAGAQRLLGYGEEEVLDRPVSIFYPPEERASRHAEAILRRTAVEGSCREEGWRVRADWAVVDMLEDGRAERIEVAVANPAREELARAYRRFAPDLHESQVPTVRVLRTGEPELIADVTPEFLSGATKSPEHARLAQELEMRSAIVVPLLARGQIMGALSLIMAESGRRYGPADLALARDIARRWRWRMSGSWRRRERRAARLSGARGRRRRCAAPPGRSAPPSRSTRWSTR